MADMKKSNILIAAAVIIASIWIILICWFCAATIKQYLKGKELTFARSQSQYKESQRKRFPTPSDEFIITGDGTTSLKITPGKTVSVISNKHVFNCNYSDLKNGKSKISFTRLYEYNEPVEITLPDIRMLSLYNCAEVSITGFNRKEMKIKGTGICIFSAESCRVGSFCLDLFENQHDYEIWFKSTNQLDSLSVSTQGKGKLKLDAIGKFKNQLCVSGPVEVLTRADLYKQLTILSPPLTEKKPLREK